MAIVHHAESADAGGDGIAAYAVPKAACQAVFLMQDGGSHEGRSGMSGGEGVGCGAIGALLCCGVLDAVHKACHDDGREGVAGQQASPLRAALVARRLQAPGEQQWRVLDVVIGFVVEALVDVVVHLSHIALDGMQSDAKGKVRHAGKRHVALHRPIPFGFAYTDSLVLHIHVVLSLAHNGGGHGLGRYLKVGEFLADAAECGRQRPMQFGDLCVDGKDLKRSQQEGQEE